MINQVYINLSGSHSNIDLLEYKIHLNFTGSLTDLESKVTSVTRFHYSNLRRKNKQGLELSTCNEIFTQDGRHVAYSESCKLVRLLHSFVLATLPM